MIKIAYSPVYVHPLPITHRFPMLKYQQIPEQLMALGIMDSSQFFEPIPCEENILELTHSRDYITALKQGNLDMHHNRRIGFPLSPELIHREQVLVQGSIDCALNALESGVSLNVAGGTHHAFASRGEGFCIFNDFAVTANYLLNAGKVKQVLIVDLDVHQGNGTASLFKNNPSVFTFSMHGRHNYPFVKEESDLDVELEPHTGDEEYLGLLRFHLPEIMNRVKPDLVLYQSGVDILASDRFGQLSVSPNGCRLRDEFVFETCKNHQTPVAVAMGGGYSPDTADVVKAHVETFRTAIRIFT